MYIDKFIQHQLKMQELFMPKNSLINTLQLNLKMYQLLHPEFSQDISISKGDIELLFKPAYIKAIECLEETL